MAKENCGVAQQPKKILQLCDIKKILMNFIWKLHKKQAIFMQLWINNYTIIRKYVFFLSENETILVMNFMCYSKQKIIYKNTEILIFTI